MTCTRARFNGVASSCTLALCVGMRSCEPVESNVGDAVVHLTYAVVPPVPHALVPPVQPVPVEVWACTCASSTTAAVARATAKRGMILHVHTLERFRTRAHKIRFLSRSISYIAAVTSNDAYVQQIGNIGFDSIAWPIRLHSRAQCQSLLVCGRR